MRPSRSMPRIIAVSVAGIALLALGLRYLADWLAVWSLIFGPPPSRLCYCPLIQQFDLVSSPSPVGILVAYAFAVPSLIVIGEDMLAKRRSPPQRSMRIAGLLLIGSMAAVGSFLLVGLTTPLVGGSTGIQVALIFFLAVPVVVLSAAALLLQEELRGRPRRTP